MDNSNPQIYNRAYGDAPDYRGQVVTINGYSRSSGVGPFVPNPYYGYQYPIAPVARPYGYPPYYPYGYPPYGAYPPPSGYYYPRPYPYPYPYGAHRPGCPAAKQGFYGQQQPEPAEEEVVEDILEEVEPVYYEEPIPQKKSRGIFGAIFEALLVVLVFGATASLLYFMNAIWYGYAIVIGAAILIFISYSDKSKFFRFLSWVIALALCFAALYIARPDLEVSIIDSLITAVNAMLSFVGVGIQI
jgi:hypothetical protein